MEISKTGGLFTIIYLLIFVGAMHPALTLLSLVLVAVCAAHFALCDIRKCGVDLCKGILLLLVMQNPMIGLGAHLVGNTSDVLKLLTQIPFLVIAILWFIVRLRSLSQLHIAKKPWISFLALLAAIALSFLIGRGSMLAVLVNVRNLTVFYMTFEIGIVCLREKVHMEQLQVFFLKLAAVMFFAGLILLKADYPLYRAIGIHEVYIAKAAPFDEGALDYRFFTSLISKTYTRMGSLYYEPVSLAYFFAFALLMAFVGSWAKSWIKRVIPVAITSFGLLLTFGKGGYLIAALAVLCIFATRVLGVMFRRLPRKIHVTIIVACMLLGTAVFSIWYYQNIGAAASQHFWGIIQTWGSVTRQPWGYGLGTGGNAATILNESDQWLATGGETALMAFMYQLGIQGIVVFIWCINRIRCPFSEKNNFYSLFAFLPVILLGISLLQDNTFTPQCIVPFMLFQGGVFANTQTDDNQRWSGVKL